MFCVSSRRTSRSRPLILHRQPPGPRGETLICMGLGWQPYFPNGRPFGGVPEAGAAAVLSGLHCRQSLRGKNLAWHIKLMRGVGVQSACKRKLREGWLPRGLLCRSLPTTSSATPITQISHCFDFMLNSPWWNHRHGPLCGGSEAPLRRRRPLGVYAATRWLPFRSGNGRRCCFPLGVGAFGRLNNRRGGLRAGAGGAVWICGGGGGQAEP